ncbi:MAG: UDP-N-acetylmuramoyl-L-alanine--D-glutamate ligase [Verrucomicrobiae bacterium]|nr:UDP-N-acetylmuramoyl-L-alanine--D-glutamate ligase [Verrucomicrobiae bacterium]
MDNLLKNLNGKNALVIGLGKSGIAAAQLLSKLGATVTATDSSDTPALQKIAAKLKESNIKILLGTYPQPQKFDLAVVSPGVPTHTGFVKDLISNKIPVIGEIELGFNFLNKSKIIAITGTNGKTTTTELIEKLFKDAGYSSIACGNIGLPLCQIILDEANYDFLSLEISSFQLETIKNFKPHIAILTNITPDHFDRYKSIEEYAITKAKAFENQNHNNFAVIQKDALNQLHNYKIKIPSKIITYSYSDSSSDVYLDSTTNTIISRSDTIGPLKICLDSFKLKGVHNAENLMAAIISGRISNIPINTIISSLGAYSPAPHRCELVAEINDIKFINDSKATNVDAVIKAILSFGYPQHRKHNILLIAGGKDKGFNFDEIQPLLKERVKRAFLIGETAEKIKKSWENFTKCEIAQTIENAVLMAAKEAQPGDIVLLSPACSSFDQFNNYQHRGEIFKNEVKKLLNNNILCTKQDKTQHNVVANF